MLGILLLLLSLILYFKPKYRYISYFLYLSFMLGAYGGLCLWTDDIIGVKNKDLAIIYTFIICIYLIMSNKFRLPKTKYILWYHIFIVFLVFDIFFSYIHYGFSAYQILQGGRDFLMLFSLHILIGIEPKEFEKLFKLLLIITVVTSILYVMQIIVAKPLMPLPYSETSIDETTGMIRMYNFPPLLDLFLIISFVCPKLFGKHFILYRILFIVALVCTLGRTYILMTILALIIAQLFIGKKSKIIKVSILLLVLLIPFNDVLSNRYEKSDTSEDIQSVFHGNFKKNYDGEGGTMTYRLAWVYERFDYLMDRSFLEKIFGLGLISDSQPIVKQKYKFHIGLYNEDIQNIAQLTTPDISYGNLLSRLGMLGSVIYLIFLVYLTIYFIRKRHHNIFTAVCSAQLITMFINSFSGSTLSEPKNLAIFFLALSFCSKTELASNNALLKPLDQDESSTH